MITIIIFGLGQVLALMFMNGAGKLNDLWDEGNSHR